MDTTSVISMIILCVVIAGLLAERVVAQFQWMKQQDMMNKAFISKHTHEYTYSARDEIKKIKEENELARHAKDLIESQDDRGPSYPVT